MKGSLFDTCFLIDLERERKRGPGKAHSFLAPHSTSPAYISWTVAGEFASGFGDIYHPICAAMLRGFEVLPMSESTAHQYAVITAFLRRQNQLIGANDHWIAAAALASDLPLVTNKTAHFSRIPGLSVVAY